MGDNTIHYQGHVRMMAAASPLSRVPSARRCNMPEEATVEDVEQLHIEAWQMGIKAVAIYRDNCKVAAASGDDQERRVPRLGYRGI